MNYFDKRISWNLMRKIEENVSKLATSEVGADSKYLNPFCLNEIFLISKKFNHETTH